MMEELYNKWQLHKLDLGNTEPYQFTKSELINFAEYVLSEKLTLTDVVGRSEQLKAFLDFVDIRYKHLGTRDKIVDEFLSL